MNWRGLLSGLLVLVCLAAVWGVWSQQNQLARLRAEQQQVMAQVAAKTERSVSPGTSDTGDASSVTPPPALVVTPELLRLRSEVTRLSERRRELAGERAENERLRAQLASRGTNAAGGIRLPSDYIRSSEAQLVGFSTPENTLQSMLWAMHNHDLTNLLQAFEPEKAERFRTRVSQSPQAVEEFFSQARVLVGMRVVRRQPATGDGSIALEVEIIPDASGPAITFRQFEGQWKIVDGF
jgi:hypothetical protein